MGLSVTSGTLPPSSVAAAPTHHRSCQALPRCLGTGAAVSSGAATVAGALAGSAVGAGHVDVFVGRGREIGEDERAVVVEVEATLPVTLCSSHRWAVEKRKHS